MENTEETSQTVTTGYSLWLGRTEGGQKGVKEVEERKQVEVYN